MEHQDTSDNDDDVVIPRGKSIAHHYMSSKMVYVSFDVETGEEKCGIYVDIKIVLIRRLGYWEASKLVEYW